jgi:patatin-like phospholipase/acyl hydrolase
MKKILSIDGGGIKGIFAASVLTQIEKNNNISLCNYFDLIAGTSTGGIIAAALACGIPAEEILQLYLNNGKKIFPHGKFFSLRKTKYDTKPLKEVLESVFQSLYIKDCKTRLLIPAYNLTRNSVRVFKTPHSSDLHFDKDLKIVDCILATTAAPLYFKPHKMQGGIFVDGGVGANNPSLIAIIEGITRCEWNPDEISMLSIGGLNDLGPNKGHEKMGLTDALKIQKSFMSAEVQYADNICNLLLPKGQYIRINPGVQPKKYSLDRATKESMEDLTFLGEEEAMCHMEEIVKMFCSELKEEPRFYNLKG